MDLLERAQALIPSGTRDELLELLRACIDDGGAGALAAVQLLAGSSAYGTLDLEYKTASAVCLVRWGKAGLDALRENAVRNETSKNRSLCLGILSGIAAADLAAERMFVHDDDLFARATGSIDAHLRSTARALLREYVLSFDDEGDAASAVGFKLFQTWTVGKGSRANELIAALAVRTLATARPVIDEFERLLVSAASDEPMLQAFLGRHPQFLDPLAVQAWSQPDFMGALEPDFVIRRRDDSYLVVEIECPAKTIVTAAPQLSAECSHAIQQALAYRAFMSDRVPTMRSHFPGFTTAECLVVIGMEAGLTEPQQRVLVMSNESHHRLRIVGFDSLARRAEMILHNVVSGSAETVARLRVT